MKMRNLCKSKDWWKSRNLSWAHTVMKSYIHTDLIPLESGTLVFAADYQEELEGLIFLLN